VLPSRPLTVAGSYPAHESVWRGSILGNIRVRRVAGGIEGPHTITIPRIARKSRVTKAGHVRTHLGNLGKIVAAIAGTALDLEPILVI
jgi:hypothetical protein